MHVHADANHLFHDHPGRFVPLAAHIAEGLDEGEDHRAARGRFELNLEDRLHRRDARSTLRTLTGWGRYAELFS
jgi:NitT/TauT family transport system ATP-binding protein